MLWEGAPLGVPGARTATILAVDAVVDDPGERRRLHERTGADAADMESRRARPGGPARRLPARRSPTRPTGRSARSPSVLDADGRLRPAGVARALVDAAPHGPRARRRPPRPRCACKARCLHERERTCRLERQRTLVLLAAPRSFCAGVDRAIEIVERLLESNGPPVYVRHEIVHNDNVVRRLEALGAVFVDHEDEIPPGEICVLSAHGVAPAVRENCEKKGLRVVDAVCPLVSKVHAEARRYADSGHLVALIGHAEPRRGDRDEGRAARLRSSSSSRPRTPRELDTNGQPLAVITQTTLSLDDVAADRRRARRALRRPQAARRRGHLLRDPESPGRGQGDRQPGRDADARDRLADELERATGSSRSRRRAAPRRR